MSGNCQRITVIINEEGGYWDGSIYIQGYSYRETGYTDQKTAYRE